MIAAVVIATTPWAEAGPADVGQIDEDSSEITFTARQMNVPVPGTYAFHVHENPDCGPAKKDGKMVPGLAAGSQLWLTGPGSIDGQAFKSHLGDLPDLIVDKNGTATKAVVAARLALADIVDRATTIHDSSDDTSRRLACAVIE